MRVAPVVRPSPEERAYLEKWARSRSGSPERALRARIVLLAAEGREDVEIAERLSISRLTAARWRRRFLSARLPALERDAVRMTAVGEGGAELTRSIVRAALDAPTSGRGGLSARRVADRLGVSHSTVLRVWAAHGVKPRRIGSWSGRPDPRPEMVPVDVVGLHLDGRIAAMSFLLGRGHVPLSAPPRLDASSALAPLLYEPRADERPPSRRSRSELLRFLIASARSGGPDAELQIVATGPDASELSPQGSFSARYPRVRLELVADRSTWLRRAVPLLHAVGRGPRSSERFAARGELARAIRLFLASYRPDKGQFDWVASPEEVGRGESSAGLRVALSRTDPGAFRPAANRAMSHRTTSSVPDPRSHAMARAVLRRSLRLRKGERITIETWSGTVEYANALVLEALRIGARPLLIYQDEPTYWAAASQVPAAHLAHPGDQVRAALARTDVLVSFFGPSDRERSHALPRPVRNRLGEYHDELFAAAARAGGRAVQLAIGRVSEASARMYNVDLEQWRDELLESTLVDPAAMHRAAIRISERLRVGRELRIRHPNGTDVRLGLRGRRPLVSDGRVTAPPPKGRWDLVQLPAGVVTVALDERVGEGAFVANVPNSIGVMDTIGEIAGGRWQFDGGRLVRHGYDRGGDLFAQSYERAGPGRERPGTLSIGLNDRIHMAPLLMDQGRGRLTLQIGRNDTAGGSTRLYWWAWLILDGADLSVDGRTLVRAGQLTTGD